MPTMDKCTNYHIARKFQGLKFSRFEQILLFHDKILEVR